MPDLITEAEALEVHQQWLDQRELYTPQVLRRVLTGEGISAVTYLRARRAGMEWTHAWRRLVEELQLDAVAHPTLSAPPPVVDPERAPLGPRIRSSLPWSVTGWPALSVPVGYDHRGLPVGLSLAAVPERETELLGLGLVLDDVLACWRDTPAHLSD